jgi:DNA-binding protein HU-beta
MFLIACPIGHWYNSANACGSSKHGMSQERQAMHFNALATGTTGLFADINREHSMNKQEFISAVADQAELTKADAGRAVDAMIDVLKSALKSGDTVSLVGFGTFDVRERAARTGRNPRTGENIEIAASKSPGFKAGKALKDAVN